MRRIVPSLLRENRPFRWFFGAQSVSLLGDQISVLALPLVAVLVLDADAAQMGYLAAAGLIPNLLFALHAGAWIDRRGRRRQTMIATDIGRAALIATVPAAYALDLLTLGHLYVVAFLVGTLSVFFFVSYSTLFISLVPREHYVEGESIINGSRALSYVAGPSLAGLLVALLRAPFVLVVDAASFLVSALLLRRIDPVEPPTEAAERGHVLAGLRFILAEPIVRASLAATATLNFFNFMFFALFVLFATRELDVTPGTLGVILGAGAVGGVIGSLVSGRLSRRIGIGPAFVVGAVLFPAPLLLVPLAGGSRTAILACLFLAEFGSGLGVMILDISVGAIFAALIPDRLRARVSGAYMAVNYGVRPLGALTRRVPRERDRPAPHALDRCGGRDRGRPLAPALAGAAPARTARARGLGLGRRAEDEPHEAVDALGDVVLGDRERDANHALRVRPEGGAGDDGHVLLLEQPVCDRRRVAGPRDVDHEVEGAARPDRADAGRVQPLDRGVPAGAVGVAHDADAVLRAGQRRLARLLDDARGVRDDRLLRLAERSRDRRRRDRVAEPPAGHRVRLREREDRDRALGCAERGDAHVLALEHHLVVALVRDEPELVPLGEGDERLERLAPEDGRRSDSPAS